MGSRFIPNPNYLPHVEDAVIEALDEVGEEIRDQAAKSIGPYSSTTAANIEKESATKDSNGPFVRLRMRGLGSIFEFSKQQNRRTKKGANRGVMRKRPFFNPAKDEVLSKGLPLDRHL